MAKPIEYNPEMGTMENHRAVWETRIKTATAELEAVRGEAAEATAQARLDEIRRQYEQFLKNNNQ